MSFSCSRGGFTKPIDVIQNCYSDLGLVDLLTISGSTFNRSLSDGLSFQSFLPTDYYSQNESDSLNFQSLVAVSMIIPTSSILTMDQNVVVAGGRIEAAPATYSITYDSNALSSAQKGSWVYIDTSSGEVVLATSQGTLTEAEVACVLSGSSAPGALVEVMTEGPLVMDDWTALAGTALLSPGLTYYLTTGGLMSASAPTDGYIVSLGRAITTTEFDVEIRLPLGLT